MKKELLQTAFLMLINIIYDFDERFEFSKPRFTKSFISHKLLKHNSRNHKTHIKSTILSNLIIRYYNGILII